MTTSVIPLAAVLVSLIAVPLILFSRNRPNLRETWTILAAVVKFTLVVLLLPAAIAGTAVECRLFAIAPGIDFALRADPFGVFFALIASSLWILTSVYSIGYVRGLQEQKQTRYFASFAICLSATIGVAFSANLLTFVVFYEVLTVATYPLVVHKETPAAISAGRKYLAFTLTAGVVLIAATAWTYHIAGSVDFVPGGLLRTVSVPSHVLGGLFALFIAGVGVKAALMPLHSWLPAAMAAPTPVSALLHAVAVVKSGVFGVVRVVGFVFGPDVLHRLGLNQWLLAVAAFTIVVASLLALSEDNLKRRLAYSTVGHLSYIVLGVALLSPSGFTGALFHIAAHATMKITMFFCAGAIYVTTHRENISELDGIGKAMPWTMGAFTVAAIGLTGIPPVDGFVSKWFLGIGTIESHQVWALVVLLVSGLLNAAYFFPILHRAYFRPAPSGVHHTGTSRLMVIPLVVTAALSAVLGLAPNFLAHLYDIASIVSASVLKGRML
jgi:multicomponent Na+:H+ antiporter subunit D